MQIYEAIILIALAALAGFFIYKTTFKTGGCGCGKKDCCSKKKH
ncbi:FeoB-associated Cys-rich membrane protein [Campylobacter sp. RM12327]|nr:MULTISPECIES: FeoB-associated Cys-rich membrane protein [Campylobacter]MBE7357912.1 FeoB-associated Cys-rich membrane protein [Campylobacter sp. RM11302]MBF6669661.1 FeoB-associated Cys-rich membrane protein [Campylobacter sp. RM12327]MBF6674804.1 FeoB-associated Cys-rich membrane protein [Campylobacter sp. RM13538]MBF6675758.1 FeoB-associated Cys-rich membrane protein [Campylobacter sp. RM12321]MBF6677566.1 FeoB-associated Cys-rich membrane protein [Campylobacter sp. RM11259]